MFPTDSLWALFTIAASGAQTLRNAAQNSLTPVVGTIGATHVRFLFGLPFALAAICVVGAMRGLPTPNATFFAYTAGGAIAQILATALMLATMRERSFVVTIAYTKTEPVQVAIFGFIVLGDLVTPLLGAAIVIATAGVLLLSWPKRDQAEAFSWRPALLGTASGALFALATIGFRGGILSLPEDDYILTATFTLAVGLTIQTVLLSAWLAFRDRRVLVAIAAAWRTSLLAGFLGAFASQMWFLAFALETAAKVRTLALVEIIIAGFVSRRFFAQGVSLRDLGGMAMIVGGVILLLNA